MSTRRTWARARATTASSCGAALAAAWLTVPAIVSRETSVLRPQPTMVGWGLSVQIPEDVA